MKHTVKIVSLLVAMLLLVSCTNTPQAGQTATPVQTATAMASVTAVVSTVLETSAQAPTDAPSPTPTVSFTPVPLPTSNIIPDLPDPALWAPALKLGADEYPRVDGSTATLPLGVYMRSKITGAALAESTAITKFTTTGPSYIALAENRADLLVVYEAPEEVKKQLKDIGAKLTMKPIGLDALVFLTNQGNPVTNLTHGQIIKIYTGKIKKWSEVGGEKMDIIPYQRVSNSGSQALMVKLVMKGVKMMDAPTMLEPAEMDDLVDAIASYENTNNALGYSVYYYVRNMYKVPGVKLLSVNGVAPNSETIAAKQYPYINAFYAVMRENEPADSPAHKLFDWLTGAEGKRAVADAGYVAAN